MRRTVLILVGFLGLLGAGILAGYFGAVYGGTTDRFRGWLVFGAFVAVAAAAILIVDTVDNYTREYWLEKGLTEGRKEVSRAPKISDQD